MEKAVRKLKWRIKGLIWKLMLLIKKLNKCSLISLIEASSISILCEEHDTVEHTGKVRHWEIMEQNLMRWRYKGLAEMQGPICTSPAGFSSSLECRILNAVLVIATYKERPFPHISRIEKRKKRQASWHGPCIYTEQRQVPGSKDGSGHRKSHQRANRKQGPLCWQEKEERSGRRFELCYL